MTAPFTEENDAVDAAHYRVGLLLILAIALLLRVWKLQDQCLSSDEIIEASIAQLDVREIVTYPDGFPPFYHLLLAGWARVDPATESARWISVLAGVAAVYAVSRWAQQAVGASAGLFAAALLAVSPLHIYLSQEMRAYAAYLCLAGFALMFFFEALATNGRKSWLGFIVSAALAINTHYYAALMAALLAAVLLCVRPRWPTLSRGLCSFALLGCCSAPALVLLPGDVAYQSDGFAARAPLLATLGHTAYAFFAGFSLGPSLGELHVLPMREAAARAAPWVALLGVVAIWLLWQGWQELRRRPFGLAIIFLAVASAPLIGLAGSMAGVGPKVRYWSWILIPLLVWLAAGLARGWQGRGRWITRGAFATLICVQLFAVVNRHADPRYANEDVRAAAQYLQLESSYAVPVFVVADYMAPAVRYYLNGGDALDDWLPHVSHEVEDEGQTEQARTVAGAWIIHPRTQAEVRGSAPFDEPAISEWLAQVESLSGAGGRFWLVYSRSFHGDPQGLLIRYLKERRLVELEREFPGVMLYRGQLADQE